MNMGETERLASIKEDNEFFKRMLDLIPPTDYFDLATKQQIRAQAFPETEVTEEEPTEPSKNADKRKKKKKDKEETKKKLKLKKMDNPFHKKSVTEIQEDLYGNGEKPTGIKKQKKDVADNDGDKNGDIPNSVPVVTGSMDIDDKRARLRAKIEELQKKRGQGETKVALKRLKRQESKMLLKQRRKQQKQEKNKGGDSNSSQKPIVPTTPKHTKQNTTKPIYNSEGQIVFSKFDFASTGKKHKKSDFGGKDYKRLLEKIEHRNERIKKVKEKDETAAKCLEDKFKWEAALHKAEGEKVKDDPQLLKRALKRKEKIRDKKKQKWDDRSKQVDKQKDERLNKRNANIQKRKDANKDKKMKKLKKKGRMIPGF